MTKYKLSSRVSFLELEQDDLPPRFQRGYHVLYNRHRDKEYLVNDSIRYFIQKFSGPKSEDEIIAEVAREVQSPVAKIKDSCTSFIHFLKKKRILIPAQETEVEPAEEPFYQEGTLINQYLVTDLICNKRDIDIYTTIDTTSEQKYVIKLLNRNKILSERKYQSEKAYLEREFALLQKVKGEPAIGQALAFEEDQHGNAYIVLEMIDGRPIARFVKDRTNLNRDHIVVLIKELIQAFAALHRKGTIHGDIHSGNVLVTTVGRVKLIDLGLSINRELEEKQVVKYGGVDYYMPPERINMTSIHKFKREPDFVSDVYQIGLLMYVVLFDKLPFDGFIWEELSQAIRESEVQFPEQMINGFPVPQGLINIITKCLEKNPQNRFRDAGEILEAYKSDVLNVNAAALNNV